MLLIYLKGHEYPLQYRYDCQVNRTSAFVEIVNHLGELVAVFDKSEFVGWSRIPVEAA